MRKMKSFVATLWQRKLSIIFGGFVGLVLGGLYLAIVPPKYTSTMMITAATHGVGSLSDSAGRSTSLAGSLFGAAANPDFTLILALMHSEAIAESLQSKYQVLQKLHPEQWDNETKQWRRSHSLISTASQRLNVLFGRPESQPPNAESLTVELAKGIRIEQSENKGIYTVTFTAKDPTLAHDVLEEVYAEAENIARHDALKVASAYVSYLESELKFASNEETKRGLVELYVQQEQRKMVLSADAPFAADIVSAPTVPLRPSGPSPSVLLLISVLAGAALFSAIAIYRSSPEEGDAFEEVAAAAQ